MFFSLIGVHHLLPLLFFGQLNVDDRWLCIALGMDKLHLVLLGRLDLGLQLWVETN